MPRKLTAPGMTKCIFCYTCMLTCSRFNYKTHSVSRSALKIKTTGGMSSRYIADICMSCEKPTCAYACPTEALVPRNGGGARLIKEKCIGCKKCVSACKTKYLQFDQELKLPLMCTHCGMCAKFCPHGCLAVKVAKDENKGE